MNDQFLENFIEQNKSLVEDMKSTSHHSKERLNPFHLEGSIWTHTVMVYEKLDKNASKELKLTALLHDIGKVETRYEIKENGYVSFKQHENLSTIKSISILKQYYDFDKEYKKVIDILHMINWHGKIWRNNFDLNEYSQYLNYSFGKDIDFFQNLVTFCKADAFGRILEKEKEKEKILNRFEFLENFIPYNVHSYSKHSPYKEVIMMIGISGSGKSTYIKNNKKYENYEIIGVDEVLDSSKLSYNSSHSKKASKKAHDIVIKNIKESVEKKENVIIDMTNLTEEQREKKLRMFPTTIYKHSAIIFFKDLEEIKENCKNRKGKTIPLEVLEEQSKKLELPTNKEFTDSYFIF